MKTRNLSIFSTNWIARTLISIVFSINVLCAVQFLVQPSAYSIQFDLDGELGTVIIRSIGILFLMWNVPYAIAILNPAKYITLVISAVIMQFIGFVGETYLFVIIQYLENTRLSIFRFMVFDFAGLLLLSIALILVVRGKHNE